MNFTDARTGSKLFPLIILIFLSIGCQWMETVESTRIPQAEIRQTYVVSATRERTSVSAYFNQGGWGKSVDLDAPSKIEHNARELPQSSLNLLGGITYSASSAGVETVHRFVYTNNDGRVFRNELKFEPLDALATGEIAVSRAQETRIALSRAVGRDETVSIALKSLKPRPASENSSAAPNGKTVAPAEEYELFLNNELDESRTVIVLKPKNLKKFVNGKAVLTVEVSGELPLQEQNPAGGKMSWRYSSTVEASVTN